MQIVRLYFPLLVLIAASAFFLYDIFIDLNKGTDSVPHLLIEGIIFVVTSFALFMEIGRVVSLRKEVTMEREKVSKLTGELFSYIHIQFERWKLTDTEKEIAILLIKGLSMQEIGELRGVKEKTIRQQATGIYAKAGCSNRYELASHFIEDLINSRKEP